MINKKGYEVIIHRGEYKDMPFVKYEDSGTNVYGKADIMTEVILAVKPGTNLPSVVSSDECKEMYLWSVFERELVKKL